MEWFSDSYSLELISLDNNKIKYLAKDSFNQFNNLKKLYLNWNLIEKIEPTVFRGRFVLSELGLYDNRLTELNFGGSVKCLLNCTLNLAKNKLMYLPFVYSKDNTKMDSVYLEQNPLKCECLYDILSWGYKTESNVFGLNSEDNLPICINSLFENCSEEYDSYSADIYLRYIRN